MKHLNPLGRLNISAGGILPPGWNVNFDHPPSRTLELKVGLSTCLGIALVFVLLRLYVKLRIIRLWGWEDCELLIYIRPLFLSKLIAIGTCFIGFVRHSDHLTIQPALIISGLGTNDST